MQSAWSPVVTVTAAGVLLIIQMLLTLAVVMARRRNKQSLGDGGNEIVLRAMRRHGNFAENAGIFLIGLALFELIGGERQTAIIFAIIFIAGRLAHAIGLSLKNTVNAFRVIGIVATIGVCLTLGVRLIMLGVPLLQSPG